MIDRKNAVRYLVDYANHNIPSIVPWDPKVSVLLWRRVKDTKSNTSVVLQGDFSKL